MKKSFRYCLCYAAIQFASGMFNTAVAMTTVCLGRICTEVDLFIMCFFIYSAYMATIHNKLYEFCCRFQMFAIGFSILFIFHISRCSRCKLFISALN